MTRDASPALRSAHTAAPHRRWWPFTKRLLTVAFFAAVAALLISQARSIEWSEVGDALARYPTRSLIAAGALAALSHLIYSTFDLLGRHWTGHRLPLRQVMGVTFVSYALNLNLGTLVGGFAFRYRLYSRLGLAADVITRVLSMSLLTNWLGYLLLAGVLFTAGVVVPPQGWKIGAAALPVLGVAMLVVAAAYVLMCATAKRRSWTLRGHELTLPPLRMALLQFAMSVTNWSVIGAVLFVLLQQRVDYPQVLGVLLIAAVAGVLAHIPAGLGVLEAVFVALLGGQLPRSELLAALLAYRALYYLLPLLFAIALYLVLEARAKASSGQRRASKA